MTTKMLSTLGLLLLPTAIFACNGEDADEAASSAEMTGEPSETTPAAAGGDYAVACNGDVSARETPATETKGVSPRCIGGPPGARCAENPCAAQKIAISYEPPAARCGLTNVYVWDGTACQAHATVAQGGSMRCKGEDCPKLFKSEAECTQAFSSCVSR